MQTSAKTKAKEFMKQNHPLDISEQDIEKLLLEHERDTRYTAIDIINSQDGEWVYNGSNKYNPHIDTEDTIQKIHNMKVGG